MIEQRARVVVIGAGVGGLAAAMLLASAGFAVTLLERAATAGGKLRELAPGGRGPRVDAGPTVLTLRPVFEHLFDACGAHLADHLHTEPLSVLARHAWSGSTPLDLWADPARSEAAIGTFAGLDAARGFAAFRRRARRMFDTLDTAFMQTFKPSAAALTLRAGLPAAVSWAPFSTLWAELRTYFPDPRLRQLFARYATYCGADPFRAPATLMLIAHAEERGVWRIAGGMARLADAMARVAAAAGAELRFGTEAREILAENGRAAAVLTRAGERIEADAIVCNADPAALARGLFGPGPARRAGLREAAERSLSAVTWVARARAAGFPLAHHTVFFSDDYRGEFRRIAGGFLPDDPTVYVCAQDRGNTAHAATAAATGSERLLLLVNAPANAGKTTREEIAACETRMMARLRRCGLELELEAATVTGPADWAALFPGTEGALYGRAIHGPTAAFARPGARTKLPGLYLAGGGVHPGAGLPMAAISGRLAASALMADHASTRRFHPAAIAGGTSTR